MHYNVEVLMFYQLSKYYKQVKNKKELWQM